VHTVSCTPQFRIQVVSSLTQVTCRLAFLGQSHHGQLSKHACVNCDRDAVVCMCTQCHTHPSSAFKYFLYSPKSRVGLCSLDRECPTCAFVEVSTFLDGRGAHLQDMTPQQLFRLRGTAAMPEFKAGEQCDAMEFVRCLLGFTRSDPPPDCPLVVNVTQTTTCKVCGYTRDKHELWTDVQLAIDGRSPTVSKLIAKHLAGEDIKGVECEGQCSTGFAKLRKAREHTSRTALSFTAAEPTGATDRSFTAVAPSLPRPLSHCHSLQLNPKCD